MATLENTQDLRKRTRIQEAKATARFSKRSQKCRAPRTSTRLSSHFPVIWGCKQSLNCRWFHSTREGSHRSIKLGNCFFLRLKQRTRNTILLWPKLSHHKWWLRDSEATALQYVQSKKRHGQGCQQTNVTKAQLKYEELEFTVPYQHQTSQNTLILHQTQHHPHSQPRTNSIQRGREALKSNLQPASTTATVTNELDT